MFCARDLNLDRKQAVYINSESGHFIWIDRPDVIRDAVKIVLNKADLSLPG